jgi:hypothetical protein
MGMALELKGLKGKAMSFRANIEAIGREYDAGNEVAIEHLSDVKGLRSDVTAMRDDLKAAVDITKNSVAGSNSGEQPKPPPVPGSPEVGQSTTPFQQNQK